ncbi:molybdopterin-dependent oxidoreductase [Piscinibacter defluvii]|uniref:molybdopterin-dependent oxidoreductase n=1 Tax=Piscinibacter defluvii TaxID=1796922 RepID=UPI000FDF2B0D|nr:molybdopterin-dependent oxidoreductase [Piscinibacter defluvii]
MDVRRRQFLKGSLSLAAAAGTPFALTAPAFGALTPRRDRPWEDGYRNVLKGERVVRTINMPNCTGSCAWNVFVKDGIVQRVEQPLDYPDDEYNPRGCMKGATYHRRVYSPNRVKFPMRRVGPRGSGQWKRITWDEAFDYLASEIKRISAKYGANTVWVYPPVPATGIVKQGAGFRFASVNGFGLGTFYNWYGDLPLAHPITWNVQTEEHEFKDVLNTKYAIIWGSDILQTRMPDAHFFLDARAKGVKLVYVAPYYDPTATAVDEWVRVRPGTDGAFALGMCHVVVKRGLTDANHLLRTTSGPLLVRSDNGKYLKAVDVVSGGDAKTFMVHDASRGGVVPDVYFAGTPSLTGSWDVALKDGRTVSCTTSHTLLLKKLDEYDPQTVSEITGVPAKDIERIAVEYATTKPSSIWSGTGINHWYHGDLIGRAVIELACLTGNIGVHGGGVSPWAGQYLMRLNPTEYFFPRKDPNNPNDRYRAVPLDTAYVVNGPTKTMADKDKLWRQIRCIWAAGGNLLGEASDQSNLTRKVLPQIELIVSPEIEMSTTAQLADIVLPVVSWFELPYDIATTPAHPYIQLAEGSLAPMFEAKTDIEIYHEMCRRLGTGDIFKFNRPEPAIELLLQTGGPQVKGITFERLKKERCIRVNLPSSPYASFTDEIAGKHKFKTASGRQELYKDEDRFIEYGETLPVHKEPHMATPYGTSRVWSEAKKVRNPLYQTYPMVYHARHTRWSVHSSWRTTDEILKLDDIGQPLLELNPADAVKRGLVSGDWATAYNQNGYVKAKVKLRESVPPGAVLIYFGWQRDQIREGHWNALTHNDINPIHEIYFIPNVWGPVSGHFDQLCEVKKA